MEDMEVVLQFFLELDKATSHFQTSFGWSLSLGVHLMRVPRSLSSGVA